MPGLALVWAPKLFAYRSDRFSGWLPLASYGFPNYASWFSVEPVEVEAEEGEGGSGPLPIVVVSFLFLVGAWIFRTRQRRKG